MWSGWETYKGIARVHQPGWQGWTLVDAAKQKPGFPETLEEDIYLQHQVREFYRHLWNWLGLNEVKTQVLADVVFDAAVNMGPSRATRFLQQSMNCLNNQGKRWPDIAEDGAPGPETVKVMFQLGDYEGYVARLVACYRGVRYAEIMRKDPTQEQFAVSWLMRITV